ncbi:hypothetical protein CAEBREN_24151 [Caenorhabditis brenneri]|uniref:Uncharacterized protein n=1 Tax=Caenorhabditis brenneri TaxID=135651 RepID=G0N7F9_CAEBE|nr:hypothetical protein CAEBREN_24151 [Caenorhabditis brenneri]
MTITSKKISEKMETLNTSSSITKFQDWSVPSNPGFLPQGDDRNTTSSHKRSSKGGVREEQAAC